jgi:hypothetical protein
MTEIKYAATPTTSKVATLMNCMAAILLVGIKRYSGNIKASIKNAATTYRITLSHGSLNARLCLEKRYVTTEPATLRPKWA